MVTFRVWEDFTQAATELFTESPSAVRYCTRWRHEKGLLVLKVTDDKKCLKFKTHSSVFLNRFDVFTRSLLSKMQNRRPVVVKAVESPKPLAAAAAGGEAMVVDPVVGGAGAGAEVVKEPGKAKKKKNKKK